MGFVKGIAQQWGERGYRSTHKSLCPDHVDDVVLKGRIAGSATESECGYCDRRGAAGELIAAPVEEFMDWFMVGVRRLYGRADDEGVPFDEGEYVGKVYDSGDVAIAVFQEAQCQDWDDSRARLLDDIQSALLEDIWVERNWMWLGPDERLSYNWSSFKEVVKHEMRFLFIRWSQLDLRDPDKMSPGEFFDQLGKVIESLPELRRTVAADTAIYRGRMFGTQAASRNLAPHELGAPSIEHATTSNRMSPAGISMFYGCNDADTVVAEIGSHTSDSWAAIGKFSATRDLQMLDLSNLPAPPSIFEDVDGSDERYYNLRFLRDFVNDLARPIDVGDKHEHIEYVPTQVFTEYLRYTTNFDGLIFRSSQGSGCNYVIFCGAEGCAAHDMAGEDTLLALDPRDIRTYKVAATIRA